jgi:hypothetical protein
MMASEVLALTVVTYLKVPEAIIAFAPAATLYCPHPAHAAVAQPAK